MEMKSLPYSGITPHHMEPQKHGNKKQKTKILLNYEYPEHFISSLCCERAETQTQALAGQILVAQNILWLV